MRLLCGPCWELCKCVDGTSEGSCLWSVAAQAGGGEGGALQEGARGISPGGVAGTAGALWHSAWPHMVSPLPTGTTPPMTPRVQRASPCPSRQICARVIGSSQGVQFGTLSFEGDDLGARIAEFGICCLLCICGMYIWAAKYWHNVQMFPTL